MEGKICLVTGATSGIGLAASQQLASMGARLVVAGRDIVRCKAAVSSIRKTSGNTQAEYLLADLSSQAQVHKLASEFRNRFPALHVLVNNAGAFFLRRAMSVDNIEMTLATNHLNYFLITSLLLDTLLASAPARVVNVSSNAHRGVQIDFSDLQEKHRYRGWQAYGRSKLANILFTYELARRLAGSRVTVNALHPGFVATNMGKNNGLLARIFLPLTRLVALSPQEGARTVVYLAASPDVEGVTGRYFVEEKEVRSDPVSYDLDTARRLWRASEELTGWDASRGHS